MSKLIDTHLDGANEIVWTRDDQEVARLSSGNVFTFPAGALGGSQPVYAPIPSGDVTGATDTPLLQAAINTAIAQGRKLITAGYSLLGVATPYYVNAALVIDPDASAADGYAYLDWEHHGYAKDVSILWVGANSGTVVSAVGWKRSSINGVKIGITDGTTGVVAWDVDVTVANPSTSFLTWRDCHVNLGTGASNVGWRMGHTSGGIADISFVNWDNCSVVGNNGSAAIATQIGWVNESNNGLNLNWFGGGAYYCGKAVTNVSTSGAGSAVGNDAMYFYGFGGSHNTQDFEFNAPGSYLISGGRFENGTTFLNVPSGSGHISVNCTSVVLATYTAGAVFNFLKPGSLTLDGCYLYGTAYTAALFTLGGFTGTPGQLTVRGGGIRGADPFFTISTGSWNVKVDGVGVLNSSNQTTAQFSPRSHTVTESALRRGIGLVAEPFSINACNNATILVSQTIYFDAVELVAGQVVTNVGWFQSTAGSSLTLLKTALADKTGKILALSADSSASPGSANGYVALAMGTPYTVQTDDVYYLCVLAVGTTPPTLVRGLNATGAGDKLPGSSIIRSGVLVSQADFPAVGSSFAVTARGAFIPYLFAT